MPSIRLTLDPETLRLLGAGRYRLYALRAVASSDGAGRPLVWRVARDFLESVDITWGAALEGYASSSPVETDRRIRLGSSQPVAPGQTLQILRGGVVSPVAGGPSEAVSIHNLSDRIWTCGLAQGHDVPVVEPFCAFPVFPGFVQEVVPVERALLIFSSSQAAPGTVIGPSSELMSGAFSGSLRGTSEGLLVDLAGVDERLVRFDVHQGWEWGSGVWAEAVPATAELASLLIETPSAGPARVRARPPGSCSRN